MAARNKPAGALQTLLNTLPQTGEVSIWTDFLRRQDGFLAKEVWVPVDGDDVIVAIWWESLAQWKAIGPEACAEVDERMGEWLRPIADVHELHLAHRFEGRVDEA